MTCHQQHGNHRSQQYARSADKKRSAGQDRGVYLIVQIVWVNSTVFVYTINILYYAGF